MRVYRQYRVYYHLKPSNTEQTIMLFWMDDEGYVDNFSTRDIVYLLKTLINNEVIAEETGRIDEE